MIELIEANWLLILLAVLVGFVIAWFLMSGSRKTKVTREDPGAEPVGTKRNQALIDAPPATAKEPEPVLEPEPAPAPAQEPAASSPTVPPVATTGLAGAGVAVDATVTEAETPAPAAPAAPAAAPATTPETIPAGDGDDLTRLKGVGPKLVAQLNTLGITSFAQIAAWSEADVDRIDDQLGRFKGRIRRDNWIEQARLLESGDTAAYEAHFGKL